MVPGSAGPGPHPVLFQRQPSSATFSSNQSDNGLDSDDELPLEGVISNGSKLEVEVLSKTALPSEYSVDVV